PNEILWRDRFDILQRHGYLLRSRFRPGWVPSWKNTDLSPYVTSAKTHSAPRFVRPQCIDATRMRDGISVFVKRVVKDAAETEIQQYLSSDGRKHDPMNHSCPILDVFRDPDDEDYEYIVLPVLRSFNDPPFYAVVEVLDFMKQTLEGLLFLHNYTVAHCDCAAPNIMMDGRPLYPEGFHPAHQFKHPTVFGFAEHNKRLYSPPVKYYFIDFGMSTMYNEEWGSDPRKWNTPNGHEQDAPEIRNYSLDKTFNAYLLDIFVLGKVYEKSLLEHYSNISIIRPIVEGMTREVPEERLALHDALAMLSTIRRSLSVFRLRGRLHPMGEIENRTCAKDIRAFLIDLPNLFRYFVSKLLLRAPPS
ncbi:hypothetical protein SCHPADRAFT_818269, partial [Schizopora paradoxa]